MQLREALNDIAEIRAQIERTETYRGLRSVAVSVSSLLAFGAAVSCAYFPVEGKVNRFIGTWGVVAILSLLGVIFEMWVRAVHSENQIGKRFVWLAHRAMLVQLLPSLVVGAVLTVVVRQHRELSWMLPGLWALAYCLGLFSCRQHLPDIALLAAVYYLIRGAMSLLGATDIDRFDIELANWQMVVNFGVGQLLLAFLIYWKLERRHGETEVP